MLERMDGVGSKGEGRLAGGSHLVLLVRRRLRASEGLRLERTSWAKRAFGFALDSSRDGKQPARDVSQENCPF